MSSTPPSDDDDSAISSPPPQSNARPATGRRSRPRVRYLQCEGCEARFDRPSALRLHVFSHTGEKPYACKQCERRFSVQSNMRRHLKGCGKALRKQSRGGAHSQHTLFVHMSPPTNLSTNAPPPNFPISAQSPHFSSTSGGVSTSTSGPASSLRSTRRARASSSSSSFSPGAIETLPNLPNESAFGVQPHHSPLINRNNPDLESKSPSPDREREPPSLPELELVVERDPEHSTSAGRQQQTQSRTTRLGQGIQQPIVASSSDSISIQGIPNNRGNQRPSAASSSLNRATSASPGSTFSALSSSTSVPAPAVVALFASPRNAGLVSSSGPGTNTSNPFSASNGPAQTHSDHHAASPAPFSPSSLKKRTISEIDGPSTPGAPKRPHIYDDSSGGGGNGSSAGYPLNGSIPCGAEVTFSFPHLDGSLYRLSSSASASSVDYIPHSLQGVILPGQYHSQNSGSAYTPDFTARPHALDSPFNTATAFVEPSMFLPASSNASTITYTSTPLSSNSPSHSASPVHLPSALSLPSTSSLFSNSVPATTTATTSLTAYTPHNMSSSGSTSAIGTSSTSAYNLPAPEPWIPESLRAFKNVGELTHAVGGSHWKPRRVESSGLASGLSPYSSMHGHSPLSLGSTRVASISSSTSESASSSMSPHPPISLPLAHATSNLSGGKNPSHLEYASGVPEGSAKYEGGRMTPLLISSRTHSSDSLRTAIEPVPSPDPTDSVKLAEFHPPTFIHHHFPNYPLAQKDRDNHFPPLSASPSSDSTHASGSRLVKRTSMPLLNSAGFKSGKSVSGVTFPLQPVHPHGYDTRQTKWKEMMDTGGSAAASSHQSGPTLWENNRNLENLWPSSNATGGSPAPIQSASVTPLSTEILHVSPYPNAWYTTHSADVGESSSRPNSNSNPHLNPSPFTSAHFALPDSVAASAFALPYGPYSSLIGALGHSPQTANLLPSPFPLPFATTASTYPLSASASTSSSSSTNSHSGSSESLPLTHAHTGTSSAAAETRLERVKEEEWEERDSYASDVPSQPYHPDHWRGRLPGPKPLSPDALQKDPTRARRFLLQVMT